MTYNYYTQFPQNWQSSLPNNIRRSTAFNMSTVYPKHHHRFLPRCMQCRRGLVMRILSVCPSVCLSVRHTRALWQNGRKICPDLYTIRKNIYPSFLRSRMVGGGATPSTWNFGSTDPRWNEIADFQPIIARSSAAVTRSEKSSINANRKSITRFPMSLKMIVVRCP